MGNSSLSESTGTTNTNTPTVQKSKVQKSKLSSFGTPADPYETFKENLTKWSQKEKIPGLLKSLKYQVYRWEKGMLDHHSIVIGCESRADAGYVTMELLVDEKNETIFPFTQYIKRSEGDEKIASKKWRRYPMAVDTAFMHAMSPLTLMKKRWNGETETTMKALMELCIELIRAHGKYSKVGNSCQHFVARFADKCAEKDHCKVSSAVSSDWAVLAGGFGTGAGVGAVIGSVVAGPPGAAAGAYIGTLSGGFTGASVVDVAKNTHKTEEVNNVQLAKD